MYPHHEQYRPPRSRAQRIRDVVDAVSEAEPVAREHFAAFLADRGLLGRAAANDDDVIPLRLTVGQLIDRYLATWEGKVTLTAFAEEAVDDADEALREAQIP